MIGQEICFLFEFDLAVHTVLDPRRFSESSESPLSCRTLADETSACGSEGEH
jgi:hypothetical protein